MSDGAMTVDELIDIPVSGLTEDLADKYNGSKVKIRAINVVDKKTSWKDGKQLPEGQFIMTKVAQVETEPVGTDNAGQPLVIKEEIALKQFNGKWGFSKHEKSKAFKFFKLLKINNIKEAVGREVVIVKTTTKNGNPKLVISIPQ